jgi:hypothetical protein
VVTIEIIKRPMIKIENMTKFKSPIHSIRGLIEDKNLNLRYNLLKLHKLDGKGQKKKLILRMKS